MDPSFGSQLDGSGSPPMGIKNSRIVSPFPCTRTLYDQVDNILRRTEDLLHASESPRRDRSDNSMMTGIRDGHANLRNTSPNRDSSPNQEPSPNRVFRHLPHFGNNSYGEGSPDMNSTRQAKGISRASNIVADSKCRKVCRSPDGTSNEIVDRTSNEMVDSTSNDRTKECNTPKRAKVDCRLSLLEEKVQFLEKMVEIQQQQQQSIIVEQVPVAQKTLSVKQKTLPVTQKTVPIVQKSNHDVPNHNVLMPERALNYQVSNGVSNPQEHTLGSNQIQLPSPPGGTPPYALNPSFEMPFPLINVSPQITLESPFKAFFESESLLDVPKKTQKVLDSESYDHELFPGTMQQQTNVVHRGVQQQDGAFHSVQHLDNNPIQERPQSGSTEQRPRSSPGSPRNTSAAVGDRRQFVQANFDNDSETTKYQLRPPSIKNLSPAVAGNTKSQSPKADGASTSPRSDGRNQIRSDLTNRFIPVDLSKHNVSSLMLVARPVSPEESTSHHRSTSPKDSKRNHRFAPARRGDSHKGHEKEINDSFRSVSWSDDIHKNDHHDQQQRKITNRPVEYDKNGRRIMHQKGSPSNGKGFYTNGKGHLSNDTNHGKGHISNDTNHDKGSIPGTSHGETSLSGKTFLRAHGRVKDDKKKVIVKRTKGRSANSQPSRLSGKHGAKGNGNSSDFTQKRKHNTSKDTSQLSSMTWIREGPKRFEETHYPNLLQDRTTSLQDRKRPVTIPSPTWSAASGSPLNSPRALNAPEFTFLRQSPDSLVNPSPFTAFMRKDSPSIEGRFARLMASPIEQVSSPIQRSRPPSMPDRLRSPTPELGSPRNVGISPRNFQTSLSPIVSSGLKFSMDHELVPRTIPDLGSNSFAVNGGAENPRMKNRNSRFVRPASRPKAGAAPKAANQSRVMHRPR